MRGEERKEEGKKERKKEREKKEREKIGRRKGGYILPLNPFSVSVNMNR